RIYTGKVVDMFEPEFINFAVFNVADIFVTVGCFMFIGHLIHLMLVHSRAKKSVSSAQAAVSKPAKQQLPQTPPASGDERQELSKIMVDYYLEQGLDDRDG
ncbi:MAG: signal peptidase II, partial [Clostridiales bacterium]|nr:signal peptidase II [Clostridiales bacterium]